jgi:hypothetical protein
LDKERVFWGFSKKYHLRFWTYFALFAVQDARHTVGWVLFICFFAVQDALPYSRVGIIRMFCIRFLVFFWMQEGSII